MNNNIKMKNTLALEKAQIEKGLSDDIKFMIRKFLNRNPNYTFNRLGKTASLFNYEAEKVVLIKIKKQLNISWSELYSVIDLVKYHQI